MSEAIREKLDQVRRGGLRESGREPLQPFLISLSSVHMAMLLIASEYMRMHPGGAVGSRPETIARESLQVDIEQRFADVARMTPAEFLLKLRAGLEFEWRWTGAGDRRELKLFVKGDAHGVM